jgi:hypothetical protein
MSQHLLNTNPDILEPDCPFPPRFWWIRRIVVVSVLLVAGYIGAMIWCRNSARQRLIGEVQSIRARGEPILIEDIQTPPPHDALNAAYSLLTASNSTRLTPAESDFLYRFDADRPVDDKSMQSLAQVARASAPARQLARLARFQNETNWGITYASPLIATLLPHLGRQRELAHLLACNAIHEHLASNDAEAVELARDILRQSNVLQRDQPFLVTHLVAVGVGERACALVRVLSYDLTVHRDADATTQPGGPASHAQVRALIAELLDETDCRRGYIAGLHGERMMEYDCAVNPGGLGLWGSGVLPVVEAAYRPIFDLDAIRIMRNTTQVASAAQAGNLPAAQKQMPNPEQDFSSQSVATGASRLLSRIIMPAFNSSLKRHYQALAERRVAALRLALRLYQIDHDGRLPARLDELVPRYVGSLPADPLAADGRTFGYRVSPRALLYSVGNDGTDNGGDTTPPASRPPTTAPAGSPDDTLFWDRRDVIFPLDRYIRPPPTTDES